MTIAETAAAVGRSQGLPPSFDGSTAAINALEPSQKIQLTAGIGAYIRAHPEQFSAGQVAAADQMWTKSNDPLADPSFSFSQFAQEFTQNANDLVAKPLVTLGQNVGGTAQLLASLVPIIAIAALYVFLKPYIIATK